MYETLKKISFVFISREKNVFVSLESLSSPCLISYGDLDETPKMTNDPDEIAHKFAFHGVN